MTDDYRSPYITRYKGEVMRLRMSNPQLHEALCEMEESAKQAEYMLHRMGDRIEQLEANNAALRGALEQIKTFTSGYEADSYFKLNLTKSIDFVWQTAVNALKEA